MATKVRFMARVLPCTLLDVVGCTPRRDWRKRADDVGRMALP